MIEKLEHFRRAWLGVEHNSKPFICKDAKKALDNLETHSLKRCLENIPPKTGTSRNKSLNRKLNNIINIPKCTVKFWHRFFINEMMIAIKQMQLSIFHSYQNMKKMKKNFETFGIGISLTKVTDTEKNDKLSITIENSTSTSILDEINAEMQD